jgi:hypothetical protein
VTVLSVNIANDNSFLSAEDSIDRCVIMLSAVVLVSVAPRAVVLGYTESVNRLIAIIKEQLTSSHTQV